MKISTQNLRLFSSPSFAERRLVSSPPGSPLLDGPGHAAPRGAPAAGGPPPGRVERPRAAPALGAHGGGDAAASAETEAAEPPHDQLAPGAQVRIHLHTFLFLSKSRNP